MTGSEALLELWKRAKRLLDSRLETVLREMREAHVLEVAEYIVAGGKRLRGFTTLLVAAELSGDWGSAVDAAVAVELVHSASLAIDDVIDGDVERRGLPAAWMKYGPGRAVMVANLLISYAQRMLMERYGFPAVERSIVAWYDISRGEVRDAYMEGGDYLEIVRLKTGSLFRLAAELGAVAVGASRQIVSSMGRYGELMGVAYQLADDIVDYSRGERSPAIARLLEWLGHPRDVISAALVKLKEIVSRIDEVLRGVRGETGFSMLPLLPRFVVKTMLSEAGIQTPVPI